ncbi:SRPBCC family protein [Nocardia suismassiliense]|uniref:SRPBCC family protein n=1 Tax=Nocardia suismassiliense TaxID=2077092 RepID=UPI000D1FC254|nr:SRPBCC family protein [Nocardia suismassiliense]
MASDMFYSGPDLATLHREYAAQGRIDDAAPIHSSHEIVIEAPAVRVWAVLADVRNWPSWYPGFELKSLSEVRPGGTFQWKLGSGAVSSTFAVVAADRELTWSGKSLWIKAIDRHVLEPLDDTRTKVTVSESMGGLLLPLFYSNDKVRKVQEVRLSALKVAAEKA